MKFTVESKDFRAAMQTAGRVIPAKSPWPVLVNLKIVASDDRVILIGSDGDMTFEADVPATVAEEGAVCAPFDTLSKFVGAAKATTLTVAVSGHEVKVSAGRSRISLSAGDLDGYPNYRPPEGEPVVIDRDTFLTAVRFCAAATEEGETRYNMAGPNFSDRPEGVTVFGTQGKAMHRALMPGVKSIGGGGTMPLAAALVAMGAAEKAERVAFMVCERGWCIDVGPTRIWGKVIDAAYPDVDRITQMYGDWREVVTTSRDDLSGSITVASCGAEAGSDKARNIVIIAKPGKPVVMRGQKAVGGVLHAGRAEIEAEASGEFSGAINARFLSNAIAGMGGADVTLLVSPQGDGKVISLRPAVQSDAVDLSAIIMALRVSDAELEDVPEAAE